MILFALENHISYVLLIFISREKYSYVLKEHIEEF